MKAAVTFAWQVLAMGLVALLFFGLGLRMRDGELAALAAGPSLVAAGVFWARRRFSRAG